MNDFFDKIGIDLGILVLMLMVLVLILIVIILNMSLGLHRLKRKYTMFMKGSDGQSLERVFAQKIKEEPLFMTIITKNKIYNHNTQ